ncbi:hypothetical protein [Haloarcula sp. JP-L23]|uniref:hypothetical protein n=1 Tax=Haloarcula sp. JP-L23 TaxID=2716717 RepID=UPI00140F23D4|nr:hypothetical protein G9465_23755 [Haloarcula sp. JP-L23]
MGFADNPFAPVTHDERTVMNHLKTVFNRLSPEVQREIINELTGEKIPAIDGWVSERETNEPSPETVHLIGLSKEPPVDFGIEESSGGGPVDLFTKADQTGIAIEGKTRDSIRNEQMSRYAEALSANSTTNVSWSDLYRALERMQPEMAAYPAGLVDEFLVYLESIDLHNPHQTAKYVWGNDDGIKEIQVVESDGELLVIWRVQAAEGQGKQDTRVLQWDEFTELFEDIESRHGQDFVERIFVNGEAPYKQPELDSDTVLGEIDPIRDHVDDDNFLRLNYHEDNNSVKLRTVRPSEGGTVGMPHNPGTDRYVWYAQDDELPQLLATTSETPGFDKEFRQVLFRDRHRSKVRAHLW